MIYVYENEDNKIKESSWDDGSRFNPPGYNGPGFKIKDDSIDIIAGKVDDILFAKDAIEAKVLELANKGRKVNVLVEGYSSHQIIKGDERIEQAFNGRKLLKLCELDDKLRQLGMDGQIKFNEFSPIIQNSDLSKCWNLDQVFDANVKISEIVWKIRKLELSPYETMVYIHKYLTQNYGYGYNAIDDWGFFSLFGKKENASIISTIQNKQTICAGFASMTKAIIDELNISGLTCKYQCMRCWKKLEKPDELGKTIVDDGAHALSLITINDPKYNIKGSYLDDATWDCKNEDHPNGKGYAFFMYPVSNIIKMKKIGLSPAIGTRLSSGKYDKFGKFPKMGSKDKPIPIPVDTFEKAVKRVYSLEKDFCRDNDPVKTANEDIDISLKKALIEQADDNPLAQKADTLYTATYVYDEDNKIKDVKFELKEKDSGMEMS